MQVIKRGGKRQTEQFDHGKLRASVEAACLSVRTFEGEAVTIAEHVTGSVIHWSQAKYTVTSDDIRRVTTKYLEVFHPEAAYFYHNHQLVV